MLALYMSFIDDESQRRLFEGAILTPKMLSMMYS